MYSKGFPTPSMLTWKVTHLKWPVRANQGARTVVPLVTIDSMMPGAAPQRTKGGGPPTAVEPAVLPRRVLAKAQARPARRLLQVARAAPGELLPFHHGLPDAAHLRPVPDLVQGVPQDRQAGAVLRK